MLPYHDSYHNLVSIQATISQFESELADLMSQLKTQELETQKANSKFEFSVSEQEKLKQNFEAEKKNWADEKDFTGDSGRDGRNSSCRGNN